ncbi:pyruvoyl-dependent arginine decarboxylase [Candidatus Woesearchaeota archaeon]|nr:pyruvoyl-dependent arginine decarboxylase [Candidatus Woesearchaeota archaeon]
MIDFYNSLEELRGKSLKDKPFLFSITVGNRIPKNYFWTSGTGESDITIHAGSYHLALKEAGIECFNIMSYSSIMPGMAKEIEKPVVYTHGAVLEAITATADAKKGERATAGIIVGWLYNKKTDMRYGGLVCEYHGPFLEEEAKSSLGMSLEELYSNGFEEDYELRDIKVFIRSIIPKKNFGTALVAIGFTDYVFPVNEVSENGFIKRESET